MAAIAGKGGSVKLTTNTVAEIGEWTLQLDIDTLEATDFGDDWKESLYGLRGWSGSFSGRVDTADTNGFVALQTEALSGSSGVSLRLYINGSNYYSGTALISGFNPSASVSGTVDISISFVGTGALSYT